MSVSRFKVSQTSFYPLLGTSSKVVYLGDVYIFYGCDASTLDVRYLFFRYERTLRACRVKSEKSFHLKLYYLESVFNQACPGVNCLTKTLCVASRYHRQQNGIDSLMVIVVASASFFNDCSQYIHANRKAVLDTDRSVWANWQGDTAVLQKEQ